MTSKNQLRPWFQKNLLEAGCDEAGRGCLAGPVAAAAVILPNDFYHPILNDSKKLSESQRNLLRPIIENNAISWSVAFISNDEIDRINILQASFKAMHLAINQLNVMPEFLLIDGNRFKPYLEIAHRCIIKGDSKFSPIAAASILAKTHRDDLMKDLHTQLPHYNWDRNKGYPTPLHKKAIRDFGFSPYHRRTFQIK